MIKQSGTTQGLCTELPNTQSDNQGLCTKLPNTQSDYQDKLPNTQSDNQGLCTKLPNTQSDYQGLCTKLPNTQSDYQGLCTKLTNTQSDYQGLCTKLPSTHSDSGRVSLDQAHCEPRHVCPEWLSGVHWGVLQVEHGTERLCDIALRRLAVWLQIPPAPRGLNNPEGHTRWVE